MELTNFILVMYVSVLSIFLGFEVISKVPTTLHTPLMSATNAISGITMVGALLVIGNESLQFKPIIVVLGFLALVFASINVFGGYLVTNRMLSLFKKKKRSEDK